MAINLELEIFAVYNANVAQKEHIILKANGKVNLNSYQVKDRTFKLGKQTNIFPHVFALPNIVLEKGQYVAIFTGKGDDGWGTYAGEPCYCIHWGSNQPILNDSAFDTVELEKVTSIQKFPLKKQGV
ncbi:hypothetical protein SIO70_22995 [Chitinophaga sancti]|uniref:hypothetical protein n=1 Tax=Chitinophaga sancti TaxID=1004 RepID=UPI002A75D6ED|nr:hypothetical protein [Chitinophaga sancti]WPQ61230.1 hypothetical protein SIO70_22995 [Chitinophaga sancti]